MAIEVAINRPTAKKKTGIEQRINDFKDELTTLQQQGIGYYDLLEKRSLKLQSRVADIVRQAIFDSCAASHCYLKPSCITRKGLEISTSRRRLLF